MAAMGLSAQAQLMRSTTFYEKERVPATWYLRAGMSVNNVAGANEFTDNGEGRSIGSKLGYDIAIGFQKPFQDGGFYWGMEFACETAFQVVDGMLSFVTYNIQTAYKEKGILPRKMAIEKLKPQEKEQHKNVVETFSYVNSKFLQEMVEYVKSAQNQPVTHWEEIETSDVVKGMNETEVKLAAGRPSTVREQGNKTRWMYSNTFVVVFTDGVVTTVVM